MLKFFAVFACILCLSHNKSQNFRINSAIDDNAAAATAKYLDEHDGPINIYINSPGGSVIAGSEIIDDIQNHDGPVTCIVQNGLAASMASGIFEACQVRVMGKGGILMFHQPALSGVEGKHLDMQNAQAALDAIELANAQRIEAASHGKVTVAMYMAKTKDGHEWWVNSSEALQLGLTDKVL